MRTDKYISTKQALALTNYSERGIRDICERSPDFAFKISGNCWILDKEKFIEYAKANGRLVKKNLTTADKGSEN